MVNSDFSSDDMELVQQSRNICGIPDYKKKTNTNIISSKSKDAFDVLMKSQKKVIGSNSPGKEIQIPAINSNGTTKEAKLKQKLFLEEWALKKGGDFKKQKETLRDETIKSVLKQRKRKFTNMLTKSDDIEKESVYDEALSVTGSKLRKSKSQTPTKKLVSENIKNDKISIVVSDDDEFLEKLSPSLKKKEDMLHYFKRYHKNHKTEKIESSTSESETLDKIKVKLKSKRLVNHVNSKRKKHSLNVSKYSSPKCGKKSDNSLIKDDTILHNIKEPLSSDEENKNYLSNITSHQLRRSRRLKTKDSVVSKNKIIFTNCFSSDTDDEIINKDKKCDKENITLITDSESPNAKTTIIKNHKCNNPPLKKMKLAPLFIKGIVRPLIDPEVMKARQDFLYNTHETSKLSVISPVVPNIFQTVIHVRQLPAPNDPEFYVWDLPSFSGKYSVKSDVSVCNGDFTINLKLYSNLPCKTINKNEQNINVFNQIEKCDFKDAVLKLKTMYPKYPVFKIFKQLKQKLINIKNENIDYSSQENMYQNHIVTKNYDTTKNKPIIENGNVKNILWTEKYKPTIYDELMGNFKNVELLKKWLCLWKEYGLELSSTKRKNSSDSSSEFWSSDDESTGSSGFLDNTFVITGPVGSGKTSSVYAIANELNMNIIEVNASSKRTGKKILVKLQEATQSHKVKVGKKDDKEVQNTGKRKKRDCSLLQKSQNSQNSSNTSTTAKGKMSLILIEDADIVFDEDDGFINALFQIVRFSKRPVIIVSSDLQCPHIKKLIVDHNSVQFHALSVKIVTPWLNLLMLIESGKFFPPLCKLLIQFYKGDIRKTIMQLQCWTLGNQINDSNHDNFKFDETNKEFNNEIDSSSHCLKDTYDISCFVQTDTKENCNGNFFESEKYVTSESIDILNDVVWLSPLEKNSWSIKKFHCNMSSNIKSDKINEKFQFHSLAATLDLISAVDQIQLNKKNIFDSGIYMPRWSNITDSLIEWEREEEYIHDCSIAYCETMIDSNCNLRDSSKKISLQEVFSQDVCNQSWNDKQNLIYSQLCKFTPISSQMDRRSLSIDYMAYIRNICRSEKVRCNNNVKRNNRFFHYFSSSNIEFNENIIGEACEVFKST